MARPPQPTTKLKLNGTYREDRHGERNEPQHAGGKPLMPVGMAGRAADEWVRIVDVLDGDMLSPADQSLLASYCMAVAQLHESQASIESAGLLVEGHNGSVRRNPALMIQKQAVEVIAMTASRFGLSPADRAKLAIPKKDEDDELNALLAQRNA